jgi:SAM-dependent methyltransferase
MKASTDYQPITETEARENPLSDAWRDPSIPEQQLALTDAELKRWAAGEPIAPFDALKECMESIYGSVLEVGCGVGHCADVIAASGFVEYTGVDYSEEFIQTARKRRPRERFEVMDALSLRYPAKAFDVVVSSCCILHIVDWRTAIKEAARVASSFLVLHRTPISKGYTEYFSKRAYGVHVIEIHFNEQELLDEVAANGFAKVAEFAAGTDQKTYLFERPLAHHPV